MRVQRCTHRCYSRRKDARVWAVTGAVTESPRLRSSSHVLPYDQEEREGGLGYKKSLSPIDESPAAIFFQRPHFIFSPQCHFHCCSLSRGFPNNGVPVLHSVAA